MAQGLSGAGVKKGTAAQGLSGKKAQWHSG